MPSGNKIIGEILGSVVERDDERVDQRFINLDIYISSKTITQGLCGSFDGNKTNDLFHRFTKELSNVGYHRTTVIEAGIADSWRYTCYA